MNRIPKEPKRGGLFSLAARFTAWLYTCIAHSYIGGALTGYRRVDGSYVRWRRLLGSTVGRPVSPSRMALVEAVQGSHVLRFLRTFFRLFFGCPLRVFGCFGATYALVGLVWTILSDLLGQGYPGLWGGVTHIFPWVVVLAFALPALFSTASLAHGFRSGIARLIAVKLLGLPLDTTTLPAYACHPIACTVAVASGGLVAVAGQFQYMRSLFPLPPEGVMVLLPFLVPVSICVIGAIMAYPEAGVVLSALLLPFVWFRFEALLPLLLLVLVTWLSYALKLLLLQRTIRFDCLDTVVLLVGVLILAAGMTGTVVTQEGCLQAISLFVCLSDYFLIVNLMNTRRAISRCLTGVGISVVVVTALAYLHRLSPEGVAWLAGSPAGNAIVAGVQTMSADLEELWTAHAELFLVLVFSWLFAFLMRTDRLLYRVFCLVIMGLDICLIISTRSVSALCCIVVVTVLFFLLWSHKAPAVGLVTLPALAAGGVWLWYLFPISESVHMTLFRSGLYKQQLWRSLWEMALDHPGGIGMGEAAFLWIYPAYAAPDLGGVTESGSLLFEILLHYGFVGLLLFAVMLFLFIQKGMTSLTNAAHVKDRAMLIGGIVGLVGVMAFGTVRSFVTSPRVFFTLVLLGALCSAYANILQREDDILTAKVPDSRYTVDRYFRPGS